jgi:hypothetical protein
MIRLCCKAALLYLVIIVVVEESLISKNLYLLSQFVSPQFCFIWPRLPSSRNALQHLILTYYQPTFRRLQQDWE